MMQERNSSDSSGDYTETRIAWDSMHRAGWGEDDPIQEWIFDYIREHREQIGERMLDLGCGQGRYMIPLAKDGLHMTGLDLSPEGLGIAEQLLDEEGLSARCVCRSVHDLPFEDSEFDSVLSVQVLSHLTWPDIERTMQEVRRVLKEKGIFIWRAKSTSHDNLEPYTPVEDFGCTYRETTGKKAGIIQHSFTGDEMRLLAQEHGFAIGLGPFETAGPRYPKPGTRAHWNVVYQKTS